MLCISKRTVRRLVREREKIPSIAVDEVDAEADEDEAIVVIMRRAKVLDKRVQRQMAQQEARWRAASSLLAERRGRDLV